MSEAIFVTTPDSFEGVSRTNTSFDLRELEHAHDEEVVPGIGSLSYVRHATWALAAIRLFSSNTDIQEKAKVQSRVANALEALACKLQFFADPDHRDNRDRGSLAFRRPASKDLWTFDDLQRKENYVQNTFRQSVVSSLWGLGFCETGTTLFNQMKLTIDGEKIADAFLRKKTTDDSDVSDTLEKKKNLPLVLTNWICNNTQGNKIENSLLSAKYPTEGEKTIMKQRLLARNEADPHGDPEKRSRLIGLLQDLEDESTYQEELLIKLKNGDDRSKRHAWQIENAIRFEQVKKDVRALYNTCGNYVFRSNSVMLSVLCKDEEVKNAYAQFQTSILAYHKEAKVELPIVANELIRQGRVYLNIEETIKYLIRHEGHALSINGARVVKGPLLKEDGFAPVRIDYENWKHPRLGQLLNLWRDCNG